MELEERKLALEERKLEEEREQKFMFMDTSGMDAKQKEYIELFRDQMFAKKQMSMMGGAYGAQMSGGMSAGMGGYMNMMGGGMNVGMGDT